MLHRLDTSVKILSNGLKARQRDDGEDRALGFREKMRERGVNGRDIDFVTNKYLIAITRCDIPEKMDSESYRAKIDQRRVRDGDDQFEIQKAEAMSLTPIIALYYTKDFPFLWYRHIKNTVWRKVTWEYFCDGLKGLKR